jgi:hypothetical protein
MGIAVGVKVSVGVDVAVLVGVEVGVKVSVGVKEIVGVGVKVGDRRICGKRFGLQADKVTTNIKKNNPDLRNAISCDKYQREVRTTQIIIGTYRCGEWKRSEKKSARK